MLGAVWKGEKKGRRERGQNGMSRKRQRTLPLTAAPKTRLKDLGQGEEGGVDRHYLYSKSQQPQQNGVPNKCLPLAQTAASGSHCRGNSWAVVLLKNTMLSVITSSI